MARRPRAILFLALLIAGMCTVAAALAWARTEVDTGIGAMSRLDVGRIYLRLAASQPGTCQQAYLLGISAGFVLAPANAIEEANRSRIKWIEVPSRAGELFAGYMDGVFHNPLPYKCGIPRPRDWTDSLVGP
jgi:hypothetical protein